MGQLAPEILRGYPQSAATTITATPGDFLIVTTGTNAITVNLPTLPSNGCIVTVKKIDAGTGAITVKTTDGSTLDGVAGATGRAQAATQFLAWTLWYDGANWWQA